MLKKLIAAIGLSASSWAVQAAPHLYEFEYRSPGWMYGPIAGSFVGDDTNLDGILSLPELTALTIDDIDWLHCTGCTLSKFSYQPGADLAFMGTDFDGTTFKSYSIPVYVFYRYWYQYDNGDGFYREVEWDFNYNTVTFDVTVTPLSPVPEPQSWLMLGAGLAVLGGARRRPGKQTH